MSDAVFQHADQDGDWLDVLELGDHGFRLITEESAVDFTEQELYALGRAIKRVADERGEAL